MGNLGKPTWHPDSPIFGPTAPPTAAAAWAPENPRAPGHTALPPVRALFRDSGGHAGRTRTPDGH
eukprot:724115-Alexandrium_andersonii.AAC.1